MGSRARRIAWGMMAFILMATSTLPVLATDTLGEDFVLEIQAEPTPAPVPQDVTYYLDGTQPRPGVIPNISRLTVETLAQLSFDTPMSPAKAELANAQDSGLIVVYVLRVSVAELLKKIGRSGYSEAEYLALSQEEGFNPEESYVTLSQSKGIPAGMTVNEITLGTLPDGSTLPAGEYDGELVMVPFGEETHRQAMVNVNVQMHFAVQSDVIEVTLNKEGKAAVQIFNPIDAGHAVRYGLLISQGQLREKTGSPHNSPEQLAQQEADPNFSSLYEEYVFLSVFESGTIQPGEFLEEIAVHALPDGEQLPQGTYTAWIARYHMDEETGEEIMGDARTQIILNVP